MPKEFLSEATLELASELSNELNSGNLHVRATEKGGEVFVNGTRQIIFEAEEKQNS